MTALAVAVSALTERMPPRRTLLAGTLALLGLRLVISLARSGPVIMADEGGYLLNARILGGGTAAQMGSSPFYRGGYSLLIAPIVSLDADPVATYHAVLVVNAVLVACVAPLLYLLLARCFDVAPAAAAWAALAGAAYPSVTALSQVALSENALFPLTVAWLLCVGLLLRARTRGAATAWAAAAGACAAALWTVHGRMLVAVVLTAVLLLAGAARRRLDLRAAAGGLVVLAAGMVAARVLNDWLIATNYHGRGVDEVRRAFAPLGNLDGLLRNLAGQGWYLLTATLGIVALLVVHVLPPALRRIRARRGRPADEMLALLLVAALGLLAISALWLATATRSDELIYGRYVEPVAPVLVALGLALPTRAGWPSGARTALAVLAALTVVVAGARSGLNLPGAPSRWNVASLPSVTGSLDAPVIAVAGLVAGTALCAFVLVGRHAPGALAPLALVLFVPTTAYTVHLPVLQSERGVYPAGWTSPRTAVEQRRATAVGYDLDHFDHVRVKVYQWFLPHTPFVLFNGNRERAPSALFFSARARSGRLARERAAVVWSDPGADQVLWQLAPGR